MLTRRSFISAAVATPFATILARPAMAGEAEVFSAAGLAIRGADTVSYFLDGVACVGSADHAVMWRGATWRFATTRSMEMFMGNPEAYAPQYGGYCAYALSQGALASSVPEAWTIHEGKLYLNYSVNVRQIWSQDIPENIARADAQWPAILG